MVYRDVEGLEYIIEYEMDYRILKRVSKFHM